jgi:uncharacterized protein (DUF58 family)
LSPTARLAWLLGALALAGLVVPTAVVAAGALALVAAAAVDAWALRGRPEVEREAPRVLSRGVPAPLSVALAGAPGPVWLRQPAPPDLAVAPAEAAGRLEARLVGRRRGRHPLPPVAARVEGPLGLVRRDHRLGPEEEVLVYPDLRAAARVVRAVREGRAGEAARLDRGPLGLGTDFESVRDYVPDDDVRQVNWRATARLGRPMSNQYRIERDRDVVLLVDAGRLMAAPLGDGTRLDAAVDAASAVGLVADLLGDRAGAVAFDAEVLRRVAPARGGGRAVVRALFDVEPSARDSDYELAFRQVGEGKRAWVLVLCDLLEEAAARSLLEATPVLARRHAVAVASPVDPDLRRLVRTPPEDVRDVYAAGVALDVLAARSRVAGLLRRAGAEVVEASAERLGAACVGAYLRAKARGRL